MDQLNRLIAAFHEFGVYSDARPPLAWELADALWLARQIPPGRPAPTPESRTDQAIRSGSVHGQSLPSQSPDQDKPASPVRRREDLPQDPLPEDPKVAIHASEPGTTGTDAPAPATLRSPLPPLLSDALAIGRALRPLLRRVPSRTRRVLDEQATVHHFAELALPVPVLQGAPERLLELALVVDAHPAFVLWEPLLKELARLLARHGAFRDLRIWRIGLDDQGATRVWPGLRGGGARSPRALRDPLGRRAVLVFSDFSHPAWRDLRADQTGPDMTHWDALRDWQRRQPVALLQLLPQRLWRRTALGAAELVRLSAGAAPSPSAAGLTRPATTGATRREPDRLPVPVLTIDAASLSAWSRVLTGRPGVGLAGVHIPDAPPDAATATQTPRGPAATPDARERLRTFLAGASDPARELARHCAGMPLTLPVVRLVQQTLMPHSGPADLAELFLSGLLERATDQLAEHPAPLETLYDFAPGVRQLLIDECAPDDLLAVLERVSQAVIAQLGAPHDFLAHYADPTQPVDPGADGFEPHHRPFACIRLQVLRRLGGRFGSEARRIAEWIEGRPGAPPPAVVADDRPPPGESDPLFRGDWAATGRRLADLLAGGRAFRWLDGAYWGPEERALLKQRVKSQYGRVGGIDIPMLSGLHEALDDEAQVFSPDLLLDPWHPARMADSLHGLLHAPDRRAFSALALGIWQRTHPLPTEILAATGDLLPSGDRVESLLRRLFPDQTLSKALDEGVRALPPTAMGAWCGGEPVYAHLLATGEVQTDELPDLYPNPAGLLDRELWERLRAVAPARIGAWLDIPVASLHYTEVFALFGDADGPTATPIGQAARILLGSLSGGPVERQPIGSVWRLNQEVVVLEQDYPCCYLVVGQADSEALAALCGGAPALWISIGARLAGLPGATIDLSFNDAMQIVHAPNRDRAIAEINRLRASLLKPNPSLVFRTENGFGDDRRISRHFYGRTTERETLEQILAECDRDPTKGAAILVVGGRRMGKTSLREWLDWYVRSQATRTGKQRLSIVFDWQALPKRLHPDDLAHSFYQYARLALNAQRIPLDFQWTFPRKLDQHTQALEKFWNAVMDAKNSTGVIPLFVFDETQHLLRHDLPELQLFAKIRNWATAGLFCLVATAYPRGRGSEDSLNTLINDSKTPIYNMFTRVNLGPWTPDETWHFLFSRLSYLGIQLTRSLRGEVLRLTRGVPWIVQQLGLTLCRHQPSGLRVVSRDSWRRARNEVLHEIEAGLRTTVGTVADANDQEVTKGQTWYRVPVERQLGKDRLWEALLGLASDHAPSLLTPVTRDYWPEPASFTVDDLHRRLGGRIEVERLHDALDSLTDTTVLTGDTANRDRFFFANNLLPMWAKWADDDN